MVILLSNFRTFNPGRYNQNILHSVARRSSVPFFARHGSILSSIVDHMLTRICLTGFALLLSRGLFGQSTPGPTSSGEAASSGTSTDLFVMFGSDLVRPGLLPKANYNIGLGHTFAFFKKNPIGDEITFAYTYENAGSHGFLHTDFGSHTEALGLMKNFAIPRVKRISGYTWIQGGITSLTGDGHVDNRFYNGESLGTIVHFNDHSSIWIQETFNKTVTVPWYTTASIGYTRSW